MKYKIPEGWERVELGNIGIFKKGNAFKSKDYQDFGTRIIRVSDLTNNNINMKDCKYVDDNLAQEYMGFKLIEGDIILTTVGSWESNPNSVVGKVVKVNIDAENSLLNQNAVRIRAKENNQIFLYYKLKEKEFKDYIIGTAQGSANQASITQKSIKSYSFALPQLEEQNAIGETLSALDNKIELNNKINENLEQQAQAIFKHWFVDFEFPDENGNPYKSSGGEMIESELGAIPKKWGVGSLGKNKLGKLISSGIDKFEGEKVYLATSDVSGVDIVNNSTLVTLENRPSRANVQPKTNTVWFAKMKDSRKLILVDEIDTSLKKDYIFSTGFAGIQCTESSVYYLWTYIQSETFDIIKNSLSMGTTMQAINNSNINKIKILIPEKYILEKFNNVVSTMYKKILNSRNQNNYLAKLRETLLPKLMSGEIRIPLD